MKNKRKQKKIGMWLILLLAFILILLICFSRNAANSTKLSLGEKKWIESNRKKVINVSVLTDIPAFSADGDGVFFDYINQLKKRTGLSFNLVSYNASQEVLDNDLYFEILKSKKNISSNEMVFNNDYYVLVGKNNEKFYDASEISGKKIGVFEGDLANVSYYIPSNSAITYTSYDKEADLTSALESGKVDYIAVPKLRYLKFITEKSYYIVYNITELREYYVLKTSKQVDDALKSIVKKTYVTYENERLNNKYYTYLNAFFLSMKNISEKSKADFLSKKYNFGYVENSPYTKIVNNKMVGIDSFYLNSFKKLTGADFVYKKYNTVDELTKALNKGEVDIAPNYYNYSGLSGNYTKTSSVYNTGFYILTYAKKSTVTINSIRSLSNKKVLTTNTYLAKYLKNETKANVKTYDKITSLLRDLNEDSIIVIDKDTYEEYKNKELTNYRIIYENSKDLKNGYILRDSNENSTFKTLFTNYINTLNNKKAHNDAWASYKSGAKQINHDYFYIVGIILLVVLLSIFGKKKVKKIKKGKKEETIRYVDPLTSLKNRNYLNKNFKKWEDNAIYPQAIVVVNLNNLRHVNDVYGHEEGDRLIRLAANVLIKNQLEQSDIIRTDGNEYLIYMVGYAENKVIAYMRKLYKELNDLPYGFGATLGYSMIEDDLKSIDDAINEAVLEIRTNREMKNKSK